MIRNINHLTETKFDLLVIGGGINGAVLTWLASLSGLSVSLIDQGDFGQATSSNTQKIIHGGLRYLQSLDFVRAQQSLKARQHLMRLAPHLVHPLPCIMPLYEHGIRGKEVMWLGLQFFDLMGRMHNKTSDPSKLIPSGKILTVSEAKELIPSLPQKGLQGAAQWHDAMCWNTERLVLSFISAADRAGAVVANYVKATKLKENSGSGIIVTACDQLSGQTFDTSAKHVVNITGPWVNDLFDFSQCTSPHQKIGFACGINIITKQLFNHTTAIALRNPFNHNSRLYFVVPWRGKSIIGTEWFTHNDHPDTFRPYEWQCSQLIEGFNAAYPDAQLTLKDILHVHAGLVPRQQNTSNTDTLKILNHFKIIDHSKYGNKKIVTIVGVKYTTGGDLAQKVLRYIFPTITIPSPLSQKQLTGGEIDNLFSYKSLQFNKWSSKIDSDNFERLFMNYGTELENIIKLIFSDRTDLAGTNNICTSNHLLKAETLYAVRNEMAQKLSDVIMRRTGRGAAGPVSESEMTDVSQTMAHELGWNETRRIAEVNELNRLYPDFLQSKSKQHLSF